MKKLLSMVGIVALLAAVMGFGFVGCSDGGSSSDDVKFEAKTHTFATEELAAVCEILGVADQSGIDTVKSKDTEIVTVATDKSSITSVKAGTTTLEVTGNDKTAEVPVTVGKDGKITLGTPKEKTAGGSEQTPGSESALPWTGTEEILNADTFTALKAQLGDGVDGKDTTANTGAYLKEKAKATGIDNLKALWVDKETKNGTAQALESGKTYISFYTADAESKKAVAKVADDVLLVYSEGLGNLRMRETGVINYNGDSKRYVAVDTSKLGATGNVKVTFGITVSTSGSGNANSYVFISNSVNDMPSDSSGTAAPAGNLASKTINTSQTGTATDPFDISAEVGAGTTVYLFFSRSNNVKGGGIDVTEIKVEAAN